MNTYTTAGTLRNQQLPHGLSAGGKMIWTRTGLSVAVCNLLASLAGIGSEG
jgi:hypothetical protein